jgi:hypothetical protein
MKNRDWLGGKWWSGWEQGYRVAMEDALKAVKGMLPTNLYGGEKRQGWEAHAEALRKRLKRSLARRTGRKSK